MGVLGWIVLGSVGMGAISMAGAFTLLLSEAGLKRLLLPLVAFAAGSLIGGALFHMLPASVGVMPVMTAMAWTALGFTSFLLLEQFLHWHHCHRGELDCKKPLGTLVLLGDGLHNLLDGMAIAGVFLMDIRLGIAAWIATAAHEIPQELGDMGVLLHAGWSRKRALLFNLLSSLTFLAGGLIVYGMAQRLDVAWLVPFAAGNFLYIGASDLVPEVNKGAAPGSNALHFAAFVAGLVALFALAHGAGH